MAGYLQKVVPAGSTLKSAMDYPDLHAATASYATPDGNLITLAVQRMSRPLSLQSFTHSAGPEGLSELPSDTQLIEVRSVLPGATSAADATALEHMQVVLARKIGVAFKRVRGATPNSSAPVAPGRVQQRDVLGVRRPPRQPRPQNGIINHLAQVKAMARAADIDVQVSAGQPWPPSPVGVGATEIRVVWLLW